MPNVTDLWHRLGDPWRRTARTFVQTFIATLLIQLPTDVIPTVSVAQDAVVAAGWAAVTATLSLLHTTLDQSKVGPDTR